MLIRKWLGSVVLLAVALGTAPAVAQSGKVTFVSTQFNTAEESEKFRAILNDFGEVEFIGQEDALLLQLLEAEAATGEGTVDLVGTLHGNFPTLAEKDQLMDLNDLLVRLEGENELFDDFVGLGRLGRQNTQYYIPWMTATYIVAANVEALSYLPEGADPNALTWAELATWGKNIYTATGEAKLGFPLDGLMHRILQGSLFPSFTGASVTGFRSDEAAAMFEFLRDDLWPYVNPQSATYGFMQAPLLNGEVWIALDHTARLIDAFTERPDEFVAFPMPSGPAGRGFMVVVAGLAIPRTAPNPDGAEDLIEYLLSPDVQLQILTQLGFFSVLPSLYAVELPEGIAAEAAAVFAQNNAPDGIAALSPVGVGARGNEVNQVYRNAFLRIVVNGEDIRTVLDEEAAALQAILNETGAPCWTPDPPSGGACQIE